MFALKWFRFLTYYGSLHMCQYANKGSVTVILSFVSCNLTVLWEYIHVDRNESYVIRLFVRRPCLSECRWWGSDGSCVCISAAVADFWPVRMEWGRKRSAQTGKFERCYNPTLCREMV